MQKRILEILDKLKSGTRLAEDEFIYLDNLLNNEQNNSNIYRWMKDVWNQSSPVNVNLNFDSVLDKIRISSRRGRTNRLFIVFSRAAAILIIPLLIAALYFYSIQSNLSDLCTVTSQNGEQTSIILPDGSTVWLNVDTKLSYPLDYGRGSRSIELEGEAYFEVAKNEKLPFIVSSGQIATEALGTRFIVSAYPENPAIKSSLVEGSVMVSCSEYTKILEPGQQVYYDRTKKKLTVKIFDADYELAWKNDQLVFRLMPFEEVISRLEKWFDVDIDYNPDHFKDETLTVRFEEYESLETILKVISKTNSFTYVVDDKIIKIKKMKNSID